jgi:hypothetical protein
MDAIHVANESVMTHAQRAFDLITNECPPEAERCLVPNARCGVRHLGCRGGWMREKPVTCALEKFVSGGKQLRRSRSGFAAWKSWRVVTERVNAIDEFRTNLRRVGTLVRVPAFAYTFA